MRKLTATLFVLAALAAGCGAAPATAPADAHGRMGATSGDIPWVTTLPAITGNSQTITLFQTSAGGRGSPVAGFYSSTVNRVEFSGYFDQAITLLWQVQHTGSSTWRTVNGWTAGDPQQGHPSGCTDSSPGRGLGDTVAATTTALCDFLVAGPIMRLQAVTGGTGPSTSEYDLAIFYDRTMGM